jgi:glycosyltransferase involved in cell wall biosynthesis
MHVLMISDVYFPRINGVSTSIQTLRRELLGLGHRVTLIAPRYATDTDDEAGIVRLASRAVPRDPEDRLMRWGHLMRAGRGLAGEGVDIVHIHTPFLAHYAGVRVARDLGVPVVETYHTLFEEYFHHYLSFVPRPWLAAATRSLSRAQCRAVDALISPSSPMKDMLERYGIATPTHVIPTGLELADFASGDGAAFRARHGIAPDRPVLVFVGRVAFEKNIGFLLHAVAAVRETFPDVLLVIAGEGPALQHLQRQAAHLGIGDNVLFVGYLARGEALNSCYRAGNAFIFASRTETQGLVLLEAMALGVPVVSTAVMGTRDVLKDGEGCLIAPDNAEGFVETVLRLLRDHTLRETLSRSAVQYVRQWSAAAMAGKILHCYRETIARARTDAVAAGA